MGGPRKLITPEVEAEIRRIVTRFAIERVAAGWSVWDLAQESGVNRANINRFEAGATQPMLSTLVGLAQILELRLDVVPKHLQPLLALDEFDVAALINAAVMEAGTCPDPRLHTALDKIRVQGGGDEVDAD